MARGAAKAIELRPSLVDSVQSASAEYKAAMGLVRSGWHKTTAGAVFEMTIPIGSTATVWLPMAGQLVGGDFPGVTKKEKTAAGWRIDVGSGTYEFDLRHGS